MAALHRTLPFAEVDRMTVHVSEDLDLDVPGVHHRFLQVEVLVSAGGLCLGLCDLDGLLQPLRFGHEAHPAAAPSEDCLHEEGVADSRGRLFDLLFILRDRLSRKNGDPDTCHRLPRGELVPKEFHHPVIGADEGDVVLLADLNELRVLCEKAITRVDRLCPAQLNGADQCRDREVALRRVGRANAERLAGELQVRHPRIGLREDSDRIERQLAAGLDHAQRDLSTVGDEYLMEAHTFSKVKRGRPYSTPSPSFTKISFTRPGPSALISFITFIASMMHRVSPTFTAAPGRTNGSSSGAGRE